MIRLSVGLYDSIVMHDVSICCHIVDVKYLLFCHTESEGGRGVGGWIEAFGIRFIFVYSAVLYTFYSSERKPPEKKCVFLRFGDLNVLLLTCLHIQECEEENTLSKRKKMLSSYISWLVSSASINDRLKIFPGMTLNSWDVDEDW